MIFFLQYKEQWYQKCVMYVCPRVCVAWEKTRINHYEVKNDQKWEREG